MSGTRGEERTELTADGETASAGRPAEDADGLELMTDVYSELAEGPHWDARNRRLYWVDLSAGHLHRYDVRSGSHRMFKMGQPAGLVVTTEAGGIAVALRDGLFLFDEDTNELEQLCDPESHLPHNRFNDGKCDPAGRLWAGTMSLRGEASAGTLYRFDSGSRPVPMIVGVSISNGIGWSPDHTHMYYIDSADLTVRAYSYDRTSGDISEGRTIISFGPEDGLADGMAVDAEGKLWIAHWDGYKVTRWDPETGMRLRTVRVPARMVTSCAFGGERLDELYITTAREGMSAEELRRFPHAGGVFRFRPGVSGMPVPPVRL